jgi:hypothetical protein
MSVQEKQYEELAGEPDHLQTMAQHYLDIANAIKNSVTALDAIRDNDQQSKATDALGPAAGDLATDIERAESRYRITAQALLDYVPALRSAKSDAHTAVVNIQHWSEQVSSTSTALDKANDDVDDADDDDKDDAKTKQTTAKNNASNAKEQLEHWQGQWTTAADARNTAAETARGKITDVVEHHNNGLKNPTHHWWDSVVDFVKSAGKWVWDHLDEISNWLGVASLLLGWVPILGDILIVATLAVGALKMIKDIAEGKGWKAILGDGVGLVLTAFGGNAVKFLAKAGKFKAAGKFLSAFRGSNSARSAAFKSMYGLKPAQFARFARTGEGSAKNLSKLARPGFKAFLNDVKYPVKFENKGFGSEFSNFVKSGGGFNIGKLGTNAGFGEGAKMFAQLPTSAKVALIAMDGRKAASMVQTIGNTGNDMVHGDFALKGDRNGQLNLNPEKNLIGLAPGT